MIGYTTSQTDTLGSGPTPENPKSAAHARRRAGNPPGCPGKLPRRHHKGGSVTTTEPAGQCPVPQAMKVTEAAAVMGISRETVYKYIRAGLIAGYKHGGTTWITLAEINDYYVRKEHEGRKAQRALRAKARNSKAA